MIHFLRVHPYIYIMSKKYSALADESIDFEIKEFRWKILLSPYQKC